MAFYFKKIKYFLMKIAVAIVIPFFILPKVYSQNFIFSDDFNQLLQLNWTVVNAESTYSGPSNWFIKNGELKQTSNIWAYPEPEEYIYQLGTNLYAV
ncbi:MAG: hypothetical protein WCS69_11985, partial [Ignavibacteriaceae bacterium]